MNARLLLLLITAVMGCAEYNERPVNGQSTEETATSEQAVYLIKVDQTENGFIAILPDGQQFTDIEQFASYLPTLNQWAEDNGYTVSIQLGENIAFDLDSTLQHTMDTQANEDTGAYATLESPLVQQVGQYTVSTGGGRRGLGGCIRTVADYYAVRLNYGSYNAGNFRQVFDMHFARFNRGDRVCFGYYESVRGWTACQCEPPPMRWIRDHIYDIAVAAGVSAGVAAIIAAITAPVVSVGAFAL